MKKILFIISILILTVGILGDRAFPQTSPPPGPAPNIKTILTLEKSTYYSGQEIKAVLVLRNEGEDVIAAKNCVETDFRLYLFFTAPGQESISAQGAAIVNLPDPPLPAETVLVDNNLIQVQRVEVLKGINTGDPWGLEIDIPVNTYYPLVKPDNYVVQAAIPCRMYPGYLTNTENIKYAPKDSANWWGSLESVPVSFTLVGDGDGDGYCYPLPCPDHSVADCDDNDLTVNPGASETAGNGKDDDCNPATPDAVAVAPGRIDVKAEKHTVGSGNQPGSTKEPIVEMPLRVYDKSPGLCVSKFGVSWQDYKSIWLSCGPPENPAGLGSTDDTGIARIQVDPGNYLVIGRYDPDPNTAGDEIYMGVSVGEVDSGETVQKYLQLIVKADGKKVPAKYTVKTGSELLIIEPEYIEWDGSEELYPFIFESIGDWTVTTSVEPPEGFVADRDSLTAEVISELKALQFVITDVGSKWECTKVKYKIEHQGKAEIVMSEVGVKLSEKLAKAKGLSRFGHEDKRKK